MHRGRENAVWRKDEMTEKDLELDSKTQRGVKASLKGLRST